MCRALCKLSERGFPGCADLNGDGKRLAGIESGLTRARLANLQRISEIESRLVGTTTELGDHQISAPVDGVVFEIRTLVEDLFDTGRQTRLYRPAWGSSSPVYF
ncbi:MAG: hypothetical protein Fur0032_04550 [Terrimicrobiaceae bacterium]